jgi:hypothetical protein
MIGPLDRNRVRLRVWGNPLDPDEITRLLGHPPTNARATGEPLPSGHIPRSGFWGVEAPGGMRDDLDLRIAGLLMMLTDDLPIWRNLAARYDMNLFCGLFMADSNEGLTLRPATMALMAERCLPLGLDLYSPDLPQDLA